MSLLLLLLNNINSSIPMAARKTSAKPAAAKSKTLLSYCSLFLITTVPLSLTMAIIHMFGSSKEYDAKASELIWLPSLTTIHLATVASTVLMSRAAWLVSANGGFRLDSDALPLYISQVCLSIVWDPLVLRMRDACIGVVFCLVNLGTLFACYFMFGKVNPSSKRLVVPCSVWAGYLSFITFMLYVYF